MTFGEALETLKRGKKVARDGWHGKGMWLVLVPGKLNCLINLGTPYRYALDPQSEVTIRPHIDMYVDGEMQPGWLASQSDMLADDWTVV